MIEDLSSEKYSKVNRKSGLGLQHLKLVLKSLAKLHATTANLPPDTLNHHQQPNISEYFKVFHPLFLNCVRSLVDEISTDDGYEEEKFLAKKLSAFERNMIDKSSEAFMLHDDEFGVLCHGDLWLNNLVFVLDDDAQPVDVKMVMENCGTIRESF